MTTAQLTQDIQACKICEAYLPREPKPIFSFHAEARIAIISQAPGRIAHDKGIPWDDQSGDRLRDWIAVDRDTFYNTPHFAIIPMGFCYPGKGKTGDLPPRKECAPQWHKPILDLLPNLELYLIIGQYAQKAYFGKDRKKNLTETVRSFEEYLPKYFPLPHPSPLNVRWHRKNLWYETDVLPFLKERVKGILD